MSKDRLNKLYAEVENSIKHRPFSSSEWKIKSKNVENDWYALKQKRHNFIRAYKEFAHLPKDVNEAESEAVSYVSNRINIPTKKIESYVNSVNYPTVIGSMSEENRIALQNATNAIKMAESNIERINSLQSYNASLALGMHGQFGAIINPYEAQMLFETTSLGYQGVMLPISNAFSSGLGLLSKNLSFSDIEGIKRYFNEMNFMQHIRMAIIDAQVYGGGILTPIFKLRNNLLYLSDLKWNLNDFIGADNFSLESLMCFDRYCVVPHAENDGMYVAKFWSSLPLKLQTIFEDGAIDGRWLAKFSTETTSRSKFFRPDGFGLSVFARTKQAVYNYEQQLQFLNYALGQLSIVVFNSKSQDYMQGGSADNAWNSKVGGNQMENIRSQLSAMQQAMNIERGIYLNDVEVSSLNRSFQGVADIINAMERNASMAFNIRHDMLFGVVKSTLGYKQDTQHTPEVIQLRERYASQITKLIKWGILGYFARNNWKKQDDKGGYNRWDKNDFIKMLDSISVFYTDNIKNNEDILKESGAMNIMKLVEARLISMRGAINFLSDIPILNKAYDKGNKEYDEWLESVVRLQQTGINADDTEQSAITKINQAIIDKKDVLAPEYNTLIDENDVNSKNNIDKNSNIMYNKADVRFKPLADMGEMDDNGIIQPVRVEARRTKKEVTQRTRKLKSHEG